MIRFFLKSYQYELLNCLNRISLYGPLDQWFAQCWKLPEVNHVHGRQVVAHPLSKMTVAGSIPTHGVVFDAMLSKWVFNSEL